MPRQRKNPRTSTRESGIQVAEATPEYVAKIVAEAKSSARARALSQGSIPASSMPEGLSEDEQEAWLRQAAALEGAALHAQKTLPRDARYKPADARTAVSFRLPSTLLARLDARAAELADIEGTEPTRTELVERALEAYLRGAADGDLASRIDALVADRLADLERRLAAGTEDALEKTAAHVIARTSEGIDSLNTSLSAHISSAQSSLADRAAGAVSAAVQQVFGDPDTPPAFAN